MAVFFVRNNNPNSAVEYQTDHVVKHNTYLSIKLEKRIGRRICSFIFDILCLGIIFYLMNEFYAQTSHKIIVYSMVSFLYYGIIPAMNRGTFGQIFFHLRCIRRDGQYTGLTDYWNRFLAFHFPILIYGFILLIFRQADALAFADIWLYIYGLWTALCAISIFINPNRFGIHDYLSKTIMVHYSNQS